MAIKLIISKSNIKTFDTQRQLAKFLVIDGCSKQDILKKCNEKNYKVTFPTQNLKLMLKKK